MRHNVIGIGIARDEDRAVVEQAARDAGVPADALFSKPVEALLPFSHTLYSVVSPRQGGVQIRNNASGNPWCTLGLNVLSTTTEGSQRGFLVASHCTKYKFDINWSDITHFYQPTVVSSNRIGNEVDDPKLFTCQAHPGGCRNSDAALALYRDIVSYDLGGIARPIGRNTDDLVIDHTQPRFHIVMAMPWSIDGEIMEKVGRTTGWSGGAVASDSMYNGCVDWAVGTPSTHVILCAMIVNARAGSGDSGAPVFVINSGSDVHVRGMLLGGVPGFCQSGIDPVYPASAVYCTKFAASNLGGIEADLLYGSRTFDYR